MTTGYEVSLDPPAVVLSDVHLSMEVQPEREAAVVELLAQHRDSDAIFLGDLFEFSAADQDPGRAFRQIAAANERLFDAIKRHAHSGARVFLVAGNHDVQLIEINDQVRAVLGSHVNVVPWCLRWGTVHLEHGHVYDADNAPLHPLAPYDPAHECLGAALMRSIVVRLDVRMFAHAHHLTPVQALRLGAQVLGWRLPGVALRCGVAVGRQVVAAAWGRWGAARRAWRLGTDRLGTMACSFGVAEPTLRALAQHLPTPTHARLRSMVKRLYLDVVLATCASVVFLAWALAAATCIALVGASLGVVYLMLLRTAGVTRHLDPIAGLRRGADIVMGLTQATRVVFGHTHVEYEDAAYFNLGSFGYGGAAGRPYALVERNGRITRRYVPPDLGRQI